MASRAPSARAIPGATTMRVAIAHDYLNQYGGAERVLEALHSLYPAAPVFTSIYDAEAIVLHSFDPGFVDAAVAAIARRNTMTLSVTERQLYLELNGTSSSSEVHDHSLV